MRGVGGPLLCIGDLLSDVADEDAGGDGGGHETLPPSSPTAVPLTPFPPSDLHRLFQGSMEWESQGQSYNLSRGIAISVLILPRLESLVSTVLCSIFGDKFVVLSQIENTLNNDFSFKDLALDGYPYSLQNDIPVIHILALLWNLAGRIVSTPMFLVLILNPFLFWSYTPMHHQGVVERFSSISCIL